MSAKSPYASAAVCAPLLERLTGLLDGRKMRFMEVCGTHTATIFQSGLRAMLPGNIRHISGPGCPVCVTHDAEVALYLDLAANPDCLVATFGDLMRVPGPAGASLKHASAAGAKVEIAYSPLDALTIARNTPDRQVVFLGVGFETTAPAVAAAILTASSEGLQNFSVLSMHKLVAPAIHKLLESHLCDVDAFLLPGHVATITGVQPFQFIAEQYHKPAAVGGFEPADLLVALCSMASMLADGAPAITNMYPRAVAETGNPRARELMRQVFEPGPALWRGLGEIAGSGLSVRNEFAAYDAMKKFQLTLPKIAPVTACRCGSVLTGAIEPPQCPLFAKKCTPATPVGPCMVSSEGSCAAYFKYGDY